MNQRFNEMLYKCLNNMQLDGYDKIIYIMLLNISQEKGIINPPLMYFYARTKWSISRIRKSLSKLSQLGIITIKRVGLTENNQYTLYDC